MEITSFVELHAALAEAFGQPETGLSMSVNGIRLTATQPPHDSPCENTVFLSIDLGPMPAAQEVDAWCALMQVNFALIDERAPCFSRRPVTGEVVLQKPHRLEPGDMAGLLKDIFMMVGLAQHWQQDRFLPAMADAGVAA